MVELAWADGHCGPVSLENLRDSCPCAECKGEKVLFREYVPGPVDKSIPGRNELGSVEVVGGYAVRFSWKDGHGTGLYTWELLRSLCECDVCKRKDK